MANLPPLRHHARFARRRAGGAGHATARRLRCLHATAGRSGGAGTTAGAGAGNPTGPCAVAVGVVPGGPVDQAYPYYAQGTAAVTAPSVYQRAGVVSVIGGREHNEDAFLLRDTSGDAGPVLARLAVADGMGGHQAGEVASKLAVESAAEVLGDEPTDSDAIRRAFHAADNRIRAAAAARGNGFSMGTTLTFTVVGRQEAVVGHVGDSRAWLVHDGQLQQITVDHSRVGRLLESGVLTEAEGIAHPQANVLEQALGAGAPAQPDVFRVGIGPGDILILSTDGLHGALTRAEMEQVLRQFPSIQQACERLAALAQERGSTDNVTVLGWQYPMPALRTGTNPPTPAKSAAPSAAPARDLSPVALRLWILAGAYLAGFGIGFLLRMVR